MAHGFNDGHRSNVSPNTVRRALLCTGLHSCESELHATDARHSPSRPHDAISALNGGRGLTWALRLACGCLID